MTKAAEGTKYGDNFFVRVKIICVTQSRQKLLGVLAHACALQLSNPITVQGIMQKVWLRDDFLGREGLAEFL